METRNRSVKMCNSLKRINVATEELTTHVYAHIFAKPDLNEGNRQTHFQGSSTAF